MTLDNKEIKEKIRASDKKSKEETKEESVEVRLKNTEEKLLRSLAEIENQRRRYE